MDQKETQGNLSNWYHITIAQIYGHWSTIGRGSLWVVEPFWSVFAQTSLLDFNAWSMGSVSMYKFMFEHAIDYFQQFLFSWINQRSVILIMCMSRLKHWGISVVPCYIWDGTKRLPFSTRMHVIRHNPSLMTLLLNLNDTTLLRNCTKLAIYTNITVITIRSEIWWITLTLLSMCAMGPLALG